MKILWLVSWYPNKIEPFDGDFIQRHARAAALFNKVYVLHVRPGESDSAAVKPAVESSTAIDLKEEIIYFRKPTFIAGRIIGFFTWLKIFRTAIRKYVKENGKPDLVHVHVPMRAGLLALWMKRKYGVSFVVSEHWAIYNNVAPDAFFRRKKRFRNLTKSIIAKASKLLVVSDDLGKSINKWVLKKDFKVIPNVVDTSLFFFESQSQKKKFRFIHVSTMTPVHKRPKDLVDAFIQVQRENGNCELFMVGPFTSELNQYAASTNREVNSIFFTGEIPYAAVASELKKADAFVLSSLYENQPCAVLEALCCGLPVVATDVGGVAEVVNSDNGILVKPGDVDGLATAMLRIMTHNNYDREKIAQKANAEFNYAKVGKLFDEVYRSVRAENG